jgi:hypothetical protein
MLTIKRILFVLGFAVSVASCSERPHFSLVQNPTLVAFDKASLEVMSKEDDPHRQYDIKQKVSFTSGGQTPDLKYMDQTAERIRDFDREIYFITPVGSYGEYRHEIWYLHTTDWGRKNGSPQFFEMDKGNE